MRAVKGIAAALLFAIFLIIAGELAYYRITDRAYESFSFISLNKVYDADELANDIETLAEKYSCEAFFVAYDGENDKYIETYCCTSDDSANISAKLGISDCDFNTILSGDYSIKFTNISDWSDRDKIISGFYLSKDSKNTHDFLESLSEKYELSQSGGSDESSTELIAGAVCLVLLVLLGAYHVLSIKRDASILLTLGHDLKIICLKNILCDSIMYIAAGTAVFVGLYNLTAVKLAVKSYLYLIIAAIILNAITYILLYTGNLLSTIHNKDNSEKLLCANYGLMALSTALLISAAVLLTKNISNIKTYLSSKDFLNRFSDCAYVELSESPYWAQLIDEKYSQGNGGVISSDDNLIEQEFADYTTIFNEISNSGNSFLLSGFSFYTHEMSEGNIHDFNVVLASNSANEYLTEMTGVKPDSQEVTVLLPSSYNLGDLTSVKGWLSMYNLSYETASYTSAMIGVFGHENMTDAYSFDYNFCMLDSPIVIYVPHAEEYNFFDYQSIITDISKDGVSSIKENNDIESTAIDYITLKSRIGEYMRYILSETILICLVFAALFAYCLLLFNATVFLYLKINKKNRAILNILGHGFLYRCLDMLLIITVQSVISGAISLNLTELIAQGNMAMTVVITTIVLILEVLVFLISARRSDNSNLMNTLKGGAL